MTKQVNNIVKDSLWEKKKSSQAGCGGLINLFYGYLFSLHFRQLQNVIKNNRNTIKPKEAAAPRTLEQEGKRGGCPPTHAHTHLSQRREAPLQSQLLAFRSVF